MNSYIVSELTENRWGNRVVFEKEKKKVLSIAKIREMSKEKYTTHLIRLLWWLDINIPPLPLASFWQVFAMTSSFFSVIILLITYFLFWISEWIPLLVIGVLSPLVGLFFGLILSLFHIRRKRLHLY
ncbi:DUF6404 family protein [Klebsiella pasteurii]|uniref:DUF6404 family protein n=1 Tax=Klebsiella pasteurii TaxID=2587529 RepID=UPI0022A6F08E|nr:DUF6404 family protein [Klebsiella pasteurii]